MSTHVKQHGPWNRRNVTIHKFVGVLKYTFEKKINHVELKIAYFEKDSLSNELCR